MSLRMFSGKERRSRRGARTRSGPVEQAAGQPGADVAEDPARQALRLGRYGLITAQPQRWERSVAFHSVYPLFLQAIDERFGLVPEGYADIVVGIAEREGSEQRVETEAFLLARHTVTNAEYQLFVDHGGYQDLELWPEEIWPHLIDFVDVSGRPAPRYWRDGRHHKRQADFPVVGVCYYEAAAFARWAGYRLPTEAEWQMGATWSIRSAAHTIRRYPWGDAFDLRHCNIWATGAGHIQPVDAHASGAAPNGVLQLIGNVWEWTQSDFVAEDSEGQQIVGDALMKTVRGGAYDTYFPWQATSQFRTGLVCLLRAHNTGFRCAMDLMKPQSAAEQSPEGEQAS